MKDETSPDPSATSRPLYPTTLAVVALGRGFNVQPSGRGSVFLYRMEKGVERGELICELSAQALDAMQAMAAIRTSSP